MKLTYNNEYVGDVLLVSLKSSNAPAYTHHDGVTVIKDDGEIIGVNIFNASDKFDLEKDVVNISPTEAHVDKINEILTAADEEPVKVDLSPKFVVGYVSDKSQHPDADKLNVCKVDVGESELDIVCGAPNVDAGQKVVVAKVGAWMPDGMYIKPSKLRGVASNGMICSKKELNMEDDGVQGIYVLNDDYEIGQSFAVN